MKRIALTFFAPALLIGLLAGNGLCNDDHGGDVHYTEPVIGVIFSHDVHVNDNGLDCESCHDDLFEMESLLAQEDPNFTMKGLAEGEYCGACHDGSMAFSSETQCATCHEGVKGYNRAHGIETAGAH